jgi:hypothetical protein
LTRIRQLVLHATLRLQFQPPVPRMAEFITCE